jgi:thymidylate synthase ThyX
MHHPHYTFQKKISHTADSQDQRHRMTPGTRPVMAGHFVPDEPDCIWPMAYVKNPALMERVQRLAGKIWTTIRALLDEGVPWEHAQYLLPNATAVRFTESGDLLNLHHKWHTRLCYLAQEEIWRTCKEEVEQVAAVHPRIAKHIAAPCTLRKDAGLSPYCPEGKRFCGVLVWNLEVKDYQRTI